MSDTKNRQIANGLRRLSVAGRELVARLQSEPTLSQSSVTFALIDQILVLNEPAAVRELVPLALSTDANIRHAARLAIKALISNIHLSWWQAFDQSLRCLPYYQEWYQPWVRLQPDELGRIKIANDSDCILIGLLSSHWNGYVREEAIRKL